MIISSIEYDMIKKKKIHKELCSPQREQIEFCASLGGLGE